MTGEYRLNVEGLKATDEFKNVSLEVLRRPKRAALVSAVSLPGYTGWKRKEGFEVLTQKFRLVMQSDAVVGELVRWSIVPATAVPENHHGLFYTRFSGPEISSSVVDEHYNFSSVFQTEGLYTLEVILQFVLRDSFTAAFNVSLQDRFAYPYIGGHILNSPFSFKATAATPARVNASGSCTLSDYRNQTQNGYWSVLKVPRLVPAFGQPESVCIRHGLRKENHSLCVFCDCHPDAFFEGLVLDWKPECQLTQYDRIIPGHYHPWSKDYETSVPTYSFLHTLKANVIFIGDSTLRLQHDAMLAQTNGTLSLTTKYVPFHADAPSLKTVAEELERMIDNQTVNVVVFNAGLHFRTLVNSPHCELSALTSHLCPYVTLLQNLTSIVVALNPTGVNVYRGTVAAWHRWGNWGFTWPDDFQRFDISLPISLHMNQLANKAFPTDFYFIDGYSPSVSRPDHTERMRGRGNTEENYVGAHNVHFDVDVILLLNKQTFSILMAYLNSNG